ncbi:alcohol dehydrogenase [Microbacterium pygmaeum]|uniref:alcohol dehydrogenase n=1 Tax=Microbacterium pygmaeum TaxID=370764 RepID=A0A1G7XLS6_9MICO|nr:alcohol dehydrogenase [Microbacterium pygmaeum]SDG85051.1 alcohol dehydrogenase, propanol-preferring [Microbacterium pygmaeum]
MRAYVVERFAERLVTEERPAIQPTGTEVVLEVEGCGVCHTDLHLWDGYYELGGGKRLQLADRGIRPPLVLGHEVLGRLVRKGPDAPIDDSAIGRSFIIYPWLGCGKCEDCMLGRENLCAWPNSIGVARAGGYADECLVPHSDYLVDATGIEPNLAATYACSGLTAYSALRKVAIDHDDLLLIVGLGGVGYSGLLIAQALGFRRIVVADIDPRKRDLARGVEGVTVLDPQSEADRAVLAEMGPVAGAVDFVGVTSTAEFAIGSLRKGGIAVIVGLFGGDITLPLVPLVQRSTTVRGSYVGTLDELRELVALAQTGRLAALPVETVPFDDVNDALDRLRGGGVAGRLVLSNSTDAS